MTAKPATLSGVVLDATGCPVALARVFFTQAPRALPDVAALSGADGGFILAAPDVGRYAVACSTDSLGSASATVDVGAGGAWVELRLRA